MDSVEFTFCTPSHTLGTYIIAFCKYCRMVVTEDIKKTLSGLELFFLFFNTFVEPATLTIESKCLIINDKHLQCV